MKKNIYNFLDSEQDEAEYFSLSKEELINLKEFLNILKTKEETFINSIKSEEDSIKEKCDWVDHILFTGVQFKGKENLFFSTIRLLGQNTYLEAYYNEQSDKYITYPRFLPKCICFNKYLKDRKEQIGSLKNIQEELSNIDIIGKDVFDGYLSNRSASGKFEIEFLPFEGVALNSKFKTLAFFGDRKPKYIFEEGLDDETKEKALNKILIRQKD